VVSWRRSAGERRQQVKWLAGGAAVTLASAILALVFSSSGGSSTIQDWVDDIAWFGLAALPVSMGVGILRYRLYEIDRIISRTLAASGATRLIVNPASVDLAEQRDQLSAFAQRLVANPS
jgi:hypothetical protein